MSIEADDEPSRSGGSQSAMASGGWSVGEGDFALQVLTRNLAQRLSNAYDDILSATSRKHAPWFVIPCDNKWCRNVAISTIIVDLLQSLKLKFPQPTVDASAIKL